jgi:anthranilate synthase
VEGILREEFDALDAFLTHMWAVTVTGSPKRAAIQWLENHEDSPRGWYGGAIGFLSFNGDLNTGLTLRTVHIKNGVARVRVGATLLYDSIPEKEEEETLIKAAALLKSLELSNQNGRQIKMCNPQSSLGKKVLLVDHEDSFVHTLANYFRQTGAAVEVLRAPFARKILQEGKAYDLVVLSPGPGSPAEFALDSTIDLVLSRGLPLFGVCLGLQGIVEYFGGVLGQLDYPWHGKSSVINVCDRTPLWNNVPHEFKAGRYHSLYAKQLPDCLRVTAFSEDEVIMAIEHYELPVAAVQFHPESIMTAFNDTGMQLVNNVMSCLIRK